MSRGLVRGGISTPPFACQLVELTMMATSEGVARDISSLVDSQKTFFVINVSSDLQSQVPLVHLPSAPPPQAAPYLPNALFSLMVNWLLCSFASLQTPHSPLTTAPVTLETYLPQPARQGVVPTGCSPTRRPQAWQTRVPRFA